ncbi:MAG: D-TA family PLP-dependent enzyme [Akkermansiaceae bacterium]|nr:D-TA family PLP-dependent enzyme [Akkermansiaceae bacterium]MCP5550193.1 D-TA family PLP-dependent enzyme [Akkermansiaceae bacterium]
MSAPGTDRWYAVENADEIASPALLVWPDRVQHNIDVMIAQTGGDPARLRPHVKTHKLGEVVRMQRESGIDKFKCATVAEAEMCAQAGAGDVLLAYQPVGPNIGRMLELSRKYPDTSFAALVDDAENLDRIAAVFSAAGASLRVFADIDCGMGRTGIAPGDAAVALCRRAVDTAGVDFAGLHVYDGHIHDPDVKKRGERFEAALGLVAPFLARLDEAGVSVPLIVGGGSPTFPWHAEAIGRFGTIPYECSPGTTLLWDAGYTTKHPDLDFAVADVLLARIISKPGENRLCVDLGHKAVSGENPIENRVRFPDLPDARPVMQSEEHLVLETPEASRFAVGDVLYGVPWHVCPTVALHQEAVVIRDGRATGERWKISARDRRITV